MTCWDCVREYIEVWPVLHVLSQSKNQRGNWPTNVYLEDELNKKIKVKVKIVSLYGASSRIHASNALSSLTRAADRTATACSLQIQASAAARPGSPSQLYQGPHFL